MTQLESYDYPLPSDLIAQTPLSRRSDARMMVVDRRDNTIAHHHVRDLANFVTPQDALVLNNSKVVPARLVGRRVKTGGRWEGLFLSHDEHGLWKVLSKTRGTLQSGEEIALETPDGRNGMSLLVGTRTEDGALIVKPILDDNDHTTSPMTLLDRVGWVPLPPYIRSGRMMPSDVERYQTVYAAEAGSVAAPTAGLHFSPPLLKSLKDQGTALCPVTLHVGIGTFRPIQTASLEEHKMHSEFVAITESVVQTLKMRRANGGRIIAVGTTSVRVLETAAQNGGGELAPFAGTTDLFIKPPFTFRGVDAILTNFHFPKSSLLVLVRTFGGDELIRRAYQEAIEKEYRFFSYGDCMLIV
ncbi:MAG: tRNA preQ1(34) S-adenosylmethionine ribosyltransferase-isomerase QueA [Thermoguttaceae bacterium]